MAMTHPVTSRAHRSRCDSTIRSARREPYVPQTGPAHPSDAARPSSCRASSSTASAPCPRSLQVPNALGMMFVRRKSSISTTQRLWSLRSGERRMTPPPALAVSPGAVAGTVTDSAALRLNPTVGDASAATRRRTVRVRRRDALWDTPACEPHHIVLPRVAEGSPDGDAVDAAGVPSLWLAYRAARGGYCFADGAFVAWSSQAPFRSSVPIPVVQSDLISVCVAHAPRGQRESAGISERPERSGWDAEKRCRLSRQPPNPER